jgi:hypothetical protein
MPRRPEPTDHYQGPPVRGRLLSADEVASRLEVTGRRVRMIPATQLPYLVMEERGHRRYDPRDVDRYVRAMTRRT